MTEPLPQYPADAIRDLYRAADARILRLLTVAVADTLAADDPLTAALLNERRLTRQLRQVVDGLNAELPGLLDLVLDTAAADGEATARAQTLP